VTEDKRGATVYSVVPVPKPRQTQRDRWAKRPIVLRYRAYRDTIEALKIQIPDGGAWIIFIVPMPASWSGKKKERHDGKPHQQRPDLDNYLKGFLDAIRRIDDSRVWDIHPTKLWGHKGQIIIYRDKNK